MKRNLVYILIAFFFLSCVHSRPAHEKQKVLTAVELQPVGRTAMDSERGLELISSGSYFGFSFEGAECSLFVSLPEWLDHNYLQYSIDGIYKKRIRINKHDSLPVVIRAGKGGRHEVFVYKATEAHTGAVYISKISASKIRSVTPASLPLIEFIGNSITCGAAADPSEIPCGKADYHDQHNAFLAYGPRLARELGTHYILSSVSGAGIYRNWNSDGPAMPALYKQTRFDQQGSSWDFSRYNPRIVSIALGTNDLSNGDGVKPRPAFDSSNFVSEYLKFIQKVHSIYPDAKIALLSSPMINGPKREILQNCLDAVKSQTEKNIGKPVSVYFFKPMNARGCTGHPSIEDHAKMADELIPFFKILLNNN
jgi:hypothetical protein